MYIYIYIHIYIHISIHIHEPLGCDSAVVSHLRCAVGPPVEKKKEVPVPSPLWKPVPN